MYLNFEQVNLDVVRREKYKSFYKAAEVVSKENYLEYIITVLRVFSRFSFDSRIL